MVQYFPIVTGSLIVSGSITATEGISMSGSIASASFAANAATASFVTLAQTASFVTTAQTASFVANAQSASNAVAAQTASYANTFTVAGNLTAQTLVVQTITSSVDFVTGSTRFGTLLSNTHVFSGSVTMNPGGLFVSSSGRVGIGTITPTQALEVSGAGLFTGTLSGNTKNGVYIYDSNIQSLAGAAARDLTIGGQNISLQTGLTYTTAMYISISGSVGIGTSTPAYKLTVDGGSSDGNIGIERDTVGTNTVIGALNFTNNNGGTAYGRVRGGRNSAGDGYVSLGTGASGDTVFIMENGRMQLQYAATPNYTGSKFFLSRSDQYGLHLEAAAGYVRLRGDDDYIYISKGSTNVITIDPSDRVGIGTTSPSQKLEVNRTGASNYLVVKGDNSASYDIAQLFTDGTNSVYTGMMRGSTGRTGAFTIWTGGAERLSVTSNGNAVLNEKLITSFTSNPANVNSGASTSYSITQPTFEYQSVYLVSIIGLYNTGGANQNGYGTALVNFFNDSAVAQANATSLQGNGWSISASANTSGTFTFTFTNTAATQMSQVWIRILKLNKTFGN